jgi:Flp pilus assembly protein TadD
MKRYASRVAAISLMLLATAAASLAADVDRLLKKGDEALAAGRLQEAEEAYRKGLARSPLHPLLRLDLGIVLATQGRNEEALIELRLSESLLPGWDVSYWLTDVLIPLGRWAECQAVAERMVAMRPQSLDALDRLGVCAGRAGDNLRAAGALQRAVAIEDLPDRRRVLAWAQYDGGDFAGARDTAKRGLEITLPAAVGQGDPSVMELNRDALQYVLGLSELALGNLEEAERHLGDRPAIGVRIESLPDGLRVAQVFRGMPAERAGVRQGDVITAFNGVALGDGRPDLTDLLRVQPPGAEVLLAVRRGDETVEAVARLGVEAPPAPAPAEITGAARFAADGLSVHAVWVEPATVAAGSSFRIIVELTARSASAAASVPVRLELRVLQEGEELTRNDWTAVVVSGERQRIVKEVPRAAGRPGRYSVAVAAECPAGASEGHADFEIVS